MCLGIPGQIVDFVDRERHIAKAEVSGVRRNVNVGLLAGEVETGDWVLIHLGFALLKIDQEEARATREFLEQLREPYQQELDELSTSSTA
jgi:hydrogenase expression/formation protein HypC